jgi:hypothetical protein
MLSSLAQVADDIFYGRAVMSLALALVVLEIVVLVMAVRRRKRDLPLSFKLHAIAGAAIAALPFLIGVSVHAARALITGVFGEPDPSLKATALSHGIGGQVSGIAFGVFATGLVLLIWVVGFAYTASAPRADGRARALPPAALIAAGLLPTALGALRWTTSLIKSFAAMAGTPPEDKSAVLARALDEGRADLTRYAHISTAAIPILAVAAVVLIVMRGRVGDDAARPPSARRSLIAAGAALLLAALIFHQARPMAAENTLPWPKREGMQVSFPNGPPTPDLIGPDPVQRAPVVEVHLNDLRLDGAEGQDPQSLEDKLITLRNNYQLLHPGDVFNGIAIVAADARTPMPRLFSTLKAILRADYHQPLFAFTKDWTAVRPVLGKVDRLYTTGAAAGVFYSDGKDKWGDDPDEDAAPWKDAVALRSQDFPDYGAFARRLVELRRQGKPVVVKVDRDPR